MNKHRFTNITAHSHHKKNSKNAQLRAQKAELLSKQTHFSTSEIISLFTMHSNLTAVGKVDRMRFREVMYSYFDITDDVMLDRIFRTFDTNNDSAIDETEWVLGLSLLLRGTLEELISFCYSIYDINGDRSLARDELYHCLKSCLLSSTVTEEDIEESVKDIVEMAMRRLDVDKNGVITFSDFKLSVSSNPLLLESCGSCLVDSETVRKFMNLIS